ncbi:aldo/keto reductase [Bradyrhizobium erythrophlei]|uniref:Aldo/keto reductase n=1 Tax=Bradyrhizobium erythrophlei TaxID=1437360 RepID=A0A1M7T081_9BRAD|nr:aldo/keto reductase [Bradyrhizobium erythrophlei]SHN64112.1 Aldo/keto reductase [Bradyrhizobium erythrophlei]
MHDVLANGARIPAIGFGTYGMAHAEMLRMIPAALKGGFRHIDTAQIYRNEPEVGECTVSSGIPRSELFITTKVWVANYPESRFASSVDESLKKLRTDYVDLLLLHWPHDGVPLAEQIGLLNEAVRSGKARHIGVSNFNRQQLDQALKLSAAPLVTNQFEYHPYLNQSLLVEATRKAGLTVTAYCAMAVGRVLGDPTIAEIAASHGRTIPQVVLRWLLQQSNVVLSRTTNPDRISENLAIFDFELGEDEMAAMQTLARPNSRIVNPPGLAPVWDA